MHKELLVDALARPKRIALVECAEHTGGKDFMSKGNALADRAAKEAAYGINEETHILSIHTTTETAPALDQPYTEVARLHLRELQEAALPHEKELWEL